MGRRVTALSGRQEEVTAPFPVLSGRRKEPSALSGQWEEILVLSSRREKVPMLLGRCEEVQALSVRRKEVRSLLGGR